MKKYVCFILVISALLFSCAGTSFAFELFEPWGYVWLYGANHQTNIERDDFNSLVGRVEARIGVDLLPLWAQASLQPYVAYYGVMSSDEHSWNNNGVTGFGFQVMPLLGVDAVGWLQDLKVYWESVSIQYTGRDESDPIDNPDVLEDTDTRFGLEIWHKWNQPAQYSVENRQLLWGELWGQFSFRETNFGYGRFDTYMFYLQPKFGFYGWMLFNTLSFEPYFKADLVMSGKDFAYQNNIAYGAGLRLRPFHGGTLFNLDVRALKEFKLFIEALAVTYLKDTSEVSHDFRFGFDFSLGR